jgi:hypothetical protein
MSEPHRVRARIERVPVLGIALAGALLFLLDCGASIGAQAYADATTAATAGSTSLRGVAVQSFLGGLYEGGSYGAILPLALGRGVWAGLLFAGALEALARVAALRVTVSFDEARRA